MRVDVNKIYETTITVFGKDGFLIGWITIPAEGGEPTLKTGVLPNDPYELVDPPSPPVIDTVTDDEIGTGDGDDLKTNDSSGDVITNGGDLSSSDKELAKDTTSEDKKGLTGGQIAAIVVPIVVVVVAGAAVGIWCVLKNRSHDEADIEAP